MARVLQLTFDDGPEAIWTRHVLQTLERCDARGTFFMVGERVRADGALARAVLDAGHEAQLHCHRHIRHTELSEAEIERDTRMGLRALDEIGVRPRYWRPPWGVWTTATVNVAARHRLRLVGWSIDTHDWRGDPASSMLARARAQLTRSGSVLMHDALGPGARRDGCENTVELLPSLVALARSAGLAVAGAGR